MRYSDPIVDEVRAVRDAFAKEHDYDIDKLVEAFKRCELEDARSGRTIVSLPPKGVTLVRKAS
jgi:hypothetical protein